MPHSIDFDSIEARLFALHQVALGSQSFCERFRISRATEEIFEYEWWEYFGHLKAQASSTLIDTAIKIRMLQDFIQAEDKELDFKKIQMRSINGLRIGALTPSNNFLSLRDSCNKIVHATGAKLVWKECVGTNGKFEYWTGTYHLFGSEQSGRPWEAVINVPDWCTAMIRFNRMFQDTIDWSDVLKWDE